MWSQCPASEPQAGISRVLSTCSTYPTESLGRHLSVRSISMQVSPDLLTRTSPPEVCESARLLCNSSRKLSLMVIAERPYC